MHRPLETTDVELLTVASQLRRDLACWPYWTVIFVMTLAGFATLAIDLPLSRPARDHTWPKPVSEQLQRFEVFGYGVTVGVILIVVWVLDARRRSAMPRLVLMVLVAGLAADGIKLLLARIRPRDFEFEGSVWTTFGRWFAMGGGGSKFHSFPSAHTAVAVGLAVALGAMYPRGRWLFVLFAVLVGCQRVVSGAHYPSDVLWGAAVGWLVAVGVGRASLVPLGFARWENVPCKSQFSD